MGESYTKEAYKSIYKHPKWKGEAQHYEEHLAATLFHNTYTKNAVKTALGKISRILTAYYGAGEKTLDRQQTQTIEAASAITDLAESTGNGTGDIAINKTLVKALMQERRDASSVGQVMKVTTEDASSEEPSRNYTEYVIQEDLPDEKIEEFRTRKKWAALQKISDELITNQVNTEIDRDENNMLLPKGVTAGLSMENRHVLYEKIYEHYHELSARVEEEKQRLLLQVPTEIPEADRALYALQMVMYTALGKEYKAVTKMTYGMKTTNTNVGVIGQWLEKNMDKKTVIERVDSQVVDAQNKYGKVFKDMGIARKLGDIYANEFIGVVGF